MDKIPVISISGEKKTGKTGIVTQLIRILSEKGYKTASVKHTKGDHSMDNEGTDTWKMREAGSELVVFSTPSETSFIYGSDMDPQDIISVICDLEEFDIIVIEGMKDETFDEIDLATRLDTADDLDIDDLVEKTVEEIEIAGVYNQLPGLDCGKCGYPSCWDFARAVYKGEKPLGGCENIDTSGVKMKVNGKDVYLSPFPASFVKNSIKGMVKSLKGVEEPESIKIEITEENDD